MTLATLQAAFWSAVAEGHDSLDPDATFLGTDTLGATERLAIYTDMFRARCVECLREDYPKVASLFHEAFWELTMDYVLRHPSADPSLSSLGRELSGYLAERTTHRPYLSDLAALEWARVEVSEEADATPLRSPNELRGRLQLVPALRRLRLQWDICALWRALESSEPAPEPRRGPVDVIVWRKEHTVFHVVVAADEALALARAAAGAPLAEICAAFEEQSNALERAARALGSWFAEGWVCDPMTRKTT